MSDQQPESIAQELQQQGVKLFQQHELEAAADLFQQAAAAYDGEGQPDMAIEMKVNLALVYRTMGDHRQALSLMQEALAFFQAAGDQNREAQVLGNMGGTYAAQGDSEQAITCYRQAADIFHALGEEKHYGETLLALGALQVRSGQVMSGATTYEVGLDSIEDPTPQQKMLRGLFGIKRRLTGMGAPPPEAPDSPSEEDEA